MSSSSSSSSPPLLSSSPPLLLGFTSTSWRQHKHEGWGKKKIQIPYSVMLLRTLILLKIKKGAEDVEEAWCIRQQAKCESRLENILKVYCFIFELSISCHKPSQIQRVLEIHKNVMHFHLLEVHIHLDGASEGKLTSLQQSLPVPVCGNTTNSLHDNTGSVLRALPFYM